MWNNILRGFGRIYNRRRDSSQDDSGGSTCCTGNPSISSVKRFLNDNPDFLESHIMNDVDLEQLELWLIRRTQRARKPNAAVERNTRKTSLSRWKFCVHADKRKMLQELTKSLQSYPTKAHVIFELSSCMSSAVNVDGFTLYVVEPSESETLFVYLGQSSTGSSKLVKADPSDAVIPYYVAKNRETIRISKCTTDDRFTECWKDKSDLAHILCQAIAQPDGQLIAVVELYRYEGNPPFYEEDEEISSSYLVWGGIALHYAHLFLTMSKQRKLNDFLLAVVKSIFQDIVSMDTLVRKIMNFAQRLVDADRASLFLVDSKRKELYPTLFDLGNDDVQTKGQDQCEEIRFPIGTGIAGMVALTGEILNIKDAYSDPRFNPSVDQKTGYKTKTILCMPIYIRGSIIGVVQMVNKNTGYFTKDDEEAFDMFAIYCGLALHHAKLYDKIRRSEQKYKVALEVLSYHNTTTDDEIQHFLDYKEPKVAPDFDDYYFNPFAYDDNEKIKLTTQMFTDLFGLVRFDKLSLTKFVLTIKKNYRRVPYHNWSHGFSVANTMYSLVKRGTSAFRPIESLALYIGSLCHDLDHRGKNNKFMLETESPLAAIYGTSTMEHHHFNQTITILQQDGHNIFAKLSSSEYKQVLGLIKHCILATDLALFFTYKSTLQNLIDEEKFTWTNPEHRLLVLAIAMTASDLSASAKPWEIQEKTVKVIFEEFYDQGDAERAAGRTPIPMMDRNKPEEQASSQVGFLTGICIPCYTLLHRLIPESKPLLDMCQQNLNRWQKIADEGKEKHEDE